MSLAQELREARRALKHAVAHRATHKAWIVFRRRHGTQRCQGAGGVRHHTRAVKRYDRIVRSLAFSVRVLEILS